MYAFLGKGFAYAGWPPLFAGELLLLFALVALFATGRIGVLLTTPLGILMGCFLAWQVICTAPYLEAFGLDSLRDSAIWGYAAFGLITAALVLRLPGFLEVAVRRYRRFARLYLFLGPAAWLATLYLRDWLPRWPDTAVTVPLIKAGEFCVHLAGILAFVLSGLSRSNQWWVFLILSDAMLAISARGGLLALLGASCFIILLRPRLERLLIVLTAGLMIVVAMAAFDVRFDLQGTSRELSLDQLSFSLTSIVGDSQRSDLEGTKNWRLNWWRAIRDYTVNGPYFWTGKGYGINLANSDGFPAGTRDEPLRSPHNSHVTFLARSGVPGFVLWATLQITWGGLMLDSYLRARRLHLAFWSGFFAWVLTYWIAFMVSAGFDVFLEGPMAGIPFWSVFGLGWGGQISFQSLAGLRRPQSHSTAGSTPIYAHQ